MAPEPNCSNFLPLGISIKTYSNDRIMTVKHEAAGQFLYERIDPDCVVAATVELMERKDAPSGPVIIYAGEREHWKSLHPRR